MQISPMPTLCDFAIANVLDGMSRKAAAEAAGMDRQTLRDWVIRYNERGSEGLRDQPRSGRKPRLNDGQQAALKAMILRVPALRRTGSRDGGSKICAGSLRSASA